ncbi:flagellar brake protein [Candidatus Ferrigenium straubiae]|jgi:hypothetical protein|uniref:flagellar brake protein n=1 Tax=Candidatus Ferrigenium straubiae TaxID=2919506 RepID=UPI003F4AD586
MSLIPVGRDDIAVGKPLPWQLYDGEHKVLLEQGGIVSDKEHLNNLLATGAYRELSWEAPGNGNDSSNMPADLTYQEQVNADKPGSQFEFDDMKLGVGSRLQLEPPKQLGRERFLVRLIGYMRGVSLIVTTPATADGAYLRLLEGEKVMMRSFSGQNAFAFACAVELACKRPYEYLHLSFPDVIQGVLIRKVPRVRTKIIAAVQNTNSRDLEERNPALISNISANGAALNAKHPLGKKGDVLNLVFRVNLHQIDALLSLNGVIRTAVDAGDAEALGAEIIRYGIEFQNLQPNDMIILQSMVYQQIVECPHQVA